MVCYVACDGYLRLFLRGIPSHMPPGSVWRCCRAATPVEGIPICQSAPSNFSILTRDLVSSRLMAAELTASSISQPSNAQVWARWTRINGSALKLKPISAAVRPPLIWRMLINLRAKLTVFQHGLVRAGYGDMVQTDASALQIRSPESGAAVRAPSRDRIFCWMRSALPAVPARPQFSRRNQCL